MFTRRIKAPDCDGSCTCNCCIPKTMQDIEREMRNQAAFNELQRQIRRLETENGELIKIINNLSSKNDVNRKPS